MSVAEFHEGTWEWDGTAWTRLTLSKSPSARVNHAMATLSLP